MQMQRSRWAAPDLTSPGRDAIVSSAPLADEGDRQRRRPLAHARSRGSLKVCCLPDVPGPARGGGWRWCLGSSSLSWCWSSRWAAPRRRPLVTTSPNPHCSGIGGELAWARDAPGQERPKQPRLSLYIDAGNPGGHHVAGWPSGGTAPPYSACNGLLTGACSFIYGEQRAAHSYRVVAALDPVGVKTAPWWLDVELTANWAGTYQLNIAALQGFIAGLHTAGASGPIRIYSTSAQWKEITGLTPQTTATAFNGQLPDWVAGTEATLSQARQNCTRGGFTGAAPTLAQYRIGPFDADLGCAGTR